MPQRAIFHRALPRVALWGTVVEGELGWRGSRAYPQEIFVPATGAKRRVGLEAIVDGLAVYGVPIVVVDAEDQRLADFVTADLSGATARPI